MIQSDVGGIFTVGKARGTKTSKLDSERYKGSESNGIKSEDFDSDWDASFTITPPNLDCPID